MPALQKHGVTTVVRLNKAEYDNRNFTSAGIAHHDMYFIDGGNPSDAIAQSYIAIAESTEGAVGVHCKAGLGRTGVLNGLYIMKHYKWTANETIAWMRICRPGTVIGPQQEFMKEQEQQMWRDGDVWRESAGMRAPMGDKRFLKPVPEGYYERKYASNPRASIFKRKG